MNKQVIRECERAHYLMQLSSYFSELTDLPGISFAYTNLVTDTWYNQAYNIHEIVTKDLTVTKDAILKLSKEYFSEHDREICFYLTPATTPANFNKFLEQNNFTSFDEEAWMFFDLNKSALLVNECTVSNIQVKEVTDKELDLFKDVYYKTLPGPEVNEYIQCVINGYLSPPPFVSIKYFLAFMDDKAVGMLSLVTQGKYSGLYAIAVDRDYQRKGICRTLLSKAINECKLNETEYLFLQTGNGEEAQKVFEHIGFVTEFVRYGYVNKAVAEEIQHG